MEETIPVMEFIERLIPHIPEKYFKMIRYSGLYARKREIDKHLHRAMNICLFLCLQKSEFPIKSKNKAKTDFLHLGFSIQHNKFPATGGITTLSNSGV